MPSKICSLCLVHCYKHNLLCLMMDTSYCSGVALSPEMQGGMLAQKQSHIEKETPCYHHATSSAWPSRELNDPQNSSCTL